MVLPGRCGCGSTWALNDSLSLHRVSLRFEQDEVEARFVGSLRDKLAKSVAVYCMAIAASLLLAMLPELLADKSVSFEWKMARGVEAFAVILSFSFGLLMIVQQRFHLLSPVSVEILTGGFECLLILLTPLVDPFYIRKLFQTPERGIDQDEAWLLLVMDCIVTVSHMLLPMRWCVLWPLELTAALVYPTLTVCCGTFVWYRVLTLVFLVGMSSWGKRLSELREREAFSRVIAERTLRAESEFQLEQSRGRDPASSLAARATGAEGDSQEPGSVQGTATVFEQRITEGNAGAVLEHIARIGRQEHWLIEATDVEIAPGCVLGGGGFGVVVEGSFHGLPVAVKMSRNRFGEGGRQKVPAEMTEVRVLRQVRHPNVAMFFGAIIDQKLSEVAVVLELVAGVSLAEYIRGEGLSFEERPRVPDVDRYCILLGISSALRHLHGHRPAIIHGDLKPTNILVETSGVVRAKLVDFGLSRVLNRPARPLGGSLPWMAPELVRREGEPVPFPSVSTDVFSLGRLLFFVALGVGPYEGETTPSIRRLLIQGEVQTPECPEGVSLFEESCWDIGVVCADTYPPDRPGMVEVHGQIAILSRIPEIREAGGSAHCGEPNRSLQEWAKGVASMREAQRGIWQQLRQKQSQQQFQPMIVKKPIICPGESDSEAHVTGHSQSAEYRLGVPSFASTKIAI